MPNNKPHLVLNNPRGEKKYFNAQRYFEPPKIEPKDPAAYRPQKNRLSGSLNAFINGQTKRREQRDLEVPDHIEYIEIHFLSIFNDNDTYKTKSKFAEFGLSPVLYANFNQSVTFAIFNYKAFKEFVKTLQAFISSKDITQPQNTPYAIATIISDFEFISTEKILTSLGKNVLLSLVNNNSDIENSYETISQHLLAHLSELKKKGAIKEFHTDEHSTIEIEGITATTLRTIVRNYDVIFKVQSLRMPAIKTNEFNQPELTWNITIKPPVNDVIVGILDNGVKRIAPLKPIILTSNLDITNKNTPNATIAAHPHGTVVASIAAVGENIFNTNEIEFVADAFILPIKIIKSSDGYFNIYEIEKVIKKAIQRGVKIFNLSVCGPFKNYNTPVSEYAYLLDKLTYNNDILIFIAAGNLDEDDIRAMLEEDGENQLHQYPNHFYNPNESSDHHTCEFTNICIPSESFNNITVGAIAENFRPATTPHLTPFKELPAYYTRKHYINNLAKINGTNFQDSQRNKNINKPDIVMPGGDRINTTAAMQVLGFGSNGDDFYHLDSGTSIAAPLAANLAAKIVGRYQDLNMQSVKSLILNSSRQLINSQFLNQLEAKIKEEESQQLYHKSFAALDRKEKMHINSKITSESLYTSLVGHGMPDVEKALYSSDKDVTLIVQDTIAIKTHKVININIPKYLLDSSKEKILLIEATLCYKFFPVWGNHLGYNPVHISFNLCKSIVKNNPGRNSEIIADRKDDYYNKFYEKEMSVSEMAKARKQALGIKKELQSWSEDFYPASNKPFSNVQQLSIGIDKEEIKKVGCQISLAIRCTHKPDLEKDFLKFLSQRSQDFSIALRISQKQDKELADYSLYNELLDCNDLFAAGEAHAEGDDQEVDLEF